MYVQHVNKASIFTQRSTTPLSTSTCDFANFFPDFAGCGKMQSSNKSPSPTQARSSAHKSFNRAEAEVDPSKLSHQSTTKIMSSTQNTLQKEVELAKIHKEVELAKLRVTLSHDNATMLLKKREHLQTLLDRVAQQQQEAQIETDAAIDSLSVLKRQAKSIEEGIRIAKKQQKVYGTIMLQQLYKTFATVLDECPLHKQKI